MKKICIRGAKTLSGFTEAISQGFSSIGVEVVDNLPIKTLTQIHGSPGSEEEDVQHLKRAADAYLIHRPDEILLRPKIRSFFEAHPSARIVLLGDLVLSDPFWMERKYHITVIPHPFLDLSLPQKREGKYLMGAYTAWGDLRDVDHFISLSLEVRKLTDKLSFFAGGSGLTKLPDHIHLVEESFVPHFNAQLYHLNGKKRLGENSGSLHRGVTVPVIFEANNAEKLENLKVIKIEADPELKDIRYTTAAEQIALFVENGLEALLAHNLESARSNTTAVFAEKIIKLMK